MYDCKKVAEEIQRYTEAYSNGTPLITDEQFDKLKGEHELRCGQSSISDISGDVKHITPMSSMKDEFSVKDAMGFLLRNCKRYNVIDQVEHDGLIVEPKLDGISINIIYVDGILTKAITRGNGGIAGQDVTEHLKRVNHAPIDINVNGLRFNGICEFRGEAVMSIANFELMNTEREKLAKPQLANPRNTVAGVFASKNIVDVEDRLKFIDFVYWGIGKIPTITNTLRGKTLDVIPFLLEELITIATTIGFKTTLILKTYPDKMDIDDLFIKGSVSRANINIEYPIDGIAIKVNSLSARDILGSAGKYPRGNVALKLPPEKIITQLLDVVTTVGRDGVYTPVAILKPVLISGTLVERASLHNFKKVRELGVKKGDLVLVGKAGDIIPQITGVVETYNYSEQIEIPDRCPFCGSETTNVGQYERCDNINCPERNAKLMIAFVSKDFMDIKYVSEMTIRKLINEKKISSPVDLYHITENDLGKSKSTTRLLSSIRNSIGRDIIVFIKSLMIPTVGRTIGGKIVDYLMLEKRDVTSSLFKITYDELISIDGIGSVTADIYISFMKKNIDYYTRLMDVIKPTVDAGEETTLKNVDSSLSGKIIVATGKGPMTRGEFEAFISSRGGKLRDKISSDVDYLVVPDESFNNSSKAKSAKVNGISIITYVDFIDMVDTVLGKS